MRVNGLVVVGVWLMLVGLSCAQGNLKGSVNRQVIES